MGLRGGVGLSLVPPRCPLGWQVWGTVRQQGDLEAIPVLQSALEACLWAQIHSSPPGATEGGCADAGVWLEERRNRRSASTAVARRKMAASVAGPP